MKHPSKPSVGPRKGSRGDLKREELKMEGSQRRMDKAFPAENYKDFPKPNQPKGKK